MRKIKFLPLIIAVALLVSAIPFAVYAEGGDEKSYYTFEDGMGKEEIPYGDTDDVGTSYGYSSFKMMNESQAAAEGVPEGYSGWVLALGSNGGSISIGLDITNVRVAEIESISMRVWCPTGTKQDKGSGGVRFSGNGKSSWNLLHAPEAIGEWIDIVLEKDSFASFDYDGDGYCDPTNFCFRGATATGYIDHITVNIKSPDTEAPVISYDGETDIKTTAGKVFTIDATAYDEYDNANVDPEYIFSEGAVDANGLLIEGQHTCTVKFTDFAGNASTIELNLTVEAQDVTAPVLSWTAEKLYGEVGMMPVITISAIDDRDGEVEVVMSWSEGAMYLGKLLAGEHTLTLTAVDTTGNKTEKVIDVIIK